MPFPFPAASARVLWVAATAFGLATAQAAAPSGPGRPQAGPPPQEQTPLQEPLQEVVITASLRRDTALSAPISVSVVGAEQIQGVGVQHLQDVLGLVPNLNWASGTSRRDTSSCAASVRTTSGRARPIRRSGS
ncbi:hypothetical protein EZJ55_24515 [Microcystis aeruginosa EAWAG127a]|uniref:TonB-dependent receptor plug domain-containing protein n=1 Tax=Microcystis aeruginosa EAWAG127a TaxID=2529855 RepID=A0A5J5LPN7_MICAE|nr:hypothetical protein EZJ55_24515 [Microcystis aeruginosa EAWAG127a]